MDRCFINGTKVRTTMSTMVMDGHDCPSLIYDSLLVLTIAEEVIQLVLPV